MKAAFSQSDKIEKAEWMRKNPTPSERLFLETWQAHCPMPISVQPIMLGYIPDFYVKCKKTIIEIDGLIHQSQREYDAQRDKVFRDNGFKVLRVMAADVISDPLTTVLTVVAKLTAKGKKAKLPKWTRVQKLTKDHLPIYQQSKPRKKKKVRKTKKSVYE